MSYRILIVDDELKSIQALEWKLSQIDLLQSASIKQFTKSKEALKNIRENTYDLIFLDINMPNITGLELAEFIKEYQARCSIIFTTGYDEYHLDALRLSAVDYLQKPFDLPDLKEAIQRFIEKRKKFKHQSKEENERIAIHHIDGIMYVQKSEISYCSSESNYSFIHLGNGEKILTSRTLKYHEQLFGSDFYRIHNQYLVNLSSVVQYRKGSGGSVDLNDGSNLPVARRRKEELLILLGD